MDYYGPYKGDKEMSTSYLYGAHWKNKVGFKIIKGKDNYKHYFGGSHWDVPVCKNCGT